jgi:UDP-N-acetylmuramate dehydrogenase
MLSRLRAIPDLQVIENAPLAGYTRFGLGGPAQIVADASTEAALAAALRVLEGKPWTLIGGGSNLVVSDQGFDGAVLRYAASGLCIEGNIVEADGGLLLQNLVDQTVAEGLRGLETMTGIPGWVGGAIYGNAGAYGHSIDERVLAVRFFDGQNVREISNQACDFRYRESIFKRNRRWIVLSVRLGLSPASPAELKTTADGILQIRNQKYPPTLRCAGSIFKNLLLANLSPAVRARVPENIVREGKVPSAYFLEQVGAKGMIVGGIRVADYHANLLYNDAHGTAAEVRELIETLKRRVKQMYGLTLEEEVQYVGRFRNRVKKV